MKRTSLAAAAVLTLGLLAPAATAVAAPQSCGKVLIKEHKKNDHAKKNGHTKAKWVHAGKVTVDGVNVADSTLTFTVRGGKNKALRGCPMTVHLTLTTKINRNDAPAGLGAIKPGDHVNVKGRSDLNLTTTVLTHTATRISAAG